MADAPEWFWTAVDQTPESASVMLDEIELNYFAVGPSRRSRLDDDPWP